MQYLIYYVVNVFVLSIFLAITVFLIRFSIKQMRLIYVYIRTIYKRLKAMKVR
jgi:hypothetical protein